MKKILLTMLLIVVGISIVACSEMDENLSTTIKNDTFNYYEDLKPIFSSAKSVDPIFNYVIDFAKENNIEYTTTDQGYLVLKKEGKDKQAPSTTLQCSVKPGTSKIECQSLSIMLSSLKNARNIGPVTALVTEESKTSFIGAANIPAEYLQTDQLINLTYNSTPVLASSSASTETFSFTSPVVFEKATSGTAYTISITDLKGGPSYDRSSKHSNPIVHLGNFLRNCQTNNIDFNLVSFNGGQIPSEYPEEVSVTLIVEDVSVNRFLNKFQSSQANYKEKNINREPSALYTVTEVARPTQKMDDDTTSNLISLLYIIDDGVYAKSEEEESTSILSTLGKVETTGESVNVQVFIRSIIEEGLPQVEKDFQAVSQLSNYQLTVLDKSPIWLSKDNEALLSQYRKCSSKSDLSLDSTLSFKKIEVPLFLEKNPELVPISLGVNMNNGFEFAQSLVFFLEKTSQE